MAAAKGEARICLRRGKLFWALIFVGVQLLDLATTFAGLRLVGGEGNPLALALMGRWGEGGMYLTKMAVVLFILGAVWLLDRRLKYLWWTFKMATIAYCPIVAVNAIQLLWALAG